jgi:hypothetical protein
MRQGEGEAAPVRLCDRRPGADPLADLNVGEEVGVDFRHVDRTSE